MDNTERATITNVVSGKVLEKETGRGIPNLLIELFDLDGWRDPEAKGASLAGEGTDYELAADAAGKARDLAALYKLAGRVSSALTSDKGEFTFQLGPRDINLPGQSEQKPDLFLTVLAPDEPGLKREERLLHQTNEVYLNAGRREAFIIRLPAELLTKLGLRPGGDTISGEEEGKSRASLFVAAAESDRVFNAEVVAAKAAEWTAERQVRDEFRAELKDTLMTKLPVGENAPLVVRGSDTTEVQTKRTAERGVNRFNSLVGGSAENGNAPDGTGNGGDGNAMPRPRGIPVNLYLTPKDVTDLGNPFPTDPDAGDFVSLDGSLVDPILFRPNSSENPGTVLVNSNPIAAFCAEESFDTRCAKTHTGIAPETGHDHGEGDTEHDPGGENGGPENADDDAATDDGSGSSPNASTPSGSSASEPSAPEEPVEPGSDIVAMADEDVATFLARLLRDMPSPDRVLQPELFNNHSSPEELEASIKKFALPKGPAELPAKYYFSTLDIAFEHVWKQLFDESIPDLAYTANHLGGSRFGALDAIKINLLKGDFISTFLSLTPEEIPPIIARHFDITKGEYNELTPSHRDALRQISTGISARLEQRGPFGGLLGPSGPSAMDMRVMQNLREQGDRLVESVRHDDYHSLHKTLDELQQRLNSAYEFTVFAADKDYHSVNFGLICTFEQEWTPLAIQPGKLVKTIALAPKEERRYSLKSKRIEKRASREAKKQNQLSSSEASSVSRAESEIMAKANQKTNFSMSAEGSFSVGVWSGKASSTFGVEAAKESASSRKDFREAVLKAVQEYKDEVSFEVSTDTESSVESEESGLVQNTNDELSATHCFYELQKRYRLAERLYRVTPVVLVAMEVPSPEKITPAWVLSHDWILRRVLLDDSFRAALDYIANNSVGDDYALREMRKNLRQQRNLVETLRLEFSAASVEADNRYTALARKIEERIEEEHEERTDGFFSDVGDWFGGDGQDPEAAKARELAAKDAHQYALEKAEKAAAALRTEMSALHSLTEAYNATVRARLDNETRVKRLLVHLRNNILYYMQAIWSMQPPDQLALQLHKVQVPVLELASRTYQLMAKPEEDDLFASFREKDTKKHKAFLSGTLKLKDPPASGSSGSGGSGGGGSTTPDPSVPRFDTVQLVQVADLTPIACFGNYLAFPLKEHNALTEFMAAPYVDQAFGAMDPDELANVSLDQFAKYVCCLHDQLTETKFEEMKPKLRDWLKRILSAPMRNGDEIVVPTGSVFVETILGNPQIEEFKAKHRELDVYKVQEEVRKAGLENVRLAARLVNKERDDPQIDKKIMVDRLQPSIDVDEQ